MKKIASGLTGVVLTGAALVGLPAQEAQAVARTLTNDCASDRPIMVATGSGGAGTRTKISWCKTFRGDIDSFRAEAGCYTILVGKQTLAPSTTRWYSGTMLSGVSRVVVDCWSLKNLAGSP